MLVMVMHVFIYIKSGSMYMNRKKEEGLGKVVGVGQIQGKKNFKLIDKNCVS